MWAINRYTLFLFYGLVSWLVLYYIIFIYKNRRILGFAWKKNGFVLPILPLIGTFYAAIFAVMFKGMKINVLSTLQWGKKYLGKSFVAWYGYICIYTTSNPSEIKIILNHPKCFDKGKIYGIFGDVTFPTSIFVVPFEQWKMKRKHLQNSYKPSVLKTFVPSFYKESCHLVENFEDLNQRDDLFVLFSEYSFTNFFLTSAGLEEEKSYPDLKEIGKYISILQGIVASKMVEPIVPLNVWQRFFPSGRQFKKTADKVMKIIRKLIKLKKEQNCETEVFSIDNKAMPVYELVIRVLSHNMNENEIYDEIYFLTAAATETTSNALTFCFLLLGMHPEIQETLHKEIMTQIGHNYISSDDLPNLKYTEAVILETLRLFPSAPIIQRHVGADVDVGTEVIPEGVDVSIDIFHLHRDEKYWPDPLEFDPTRFLPENSSKIKPYTFLPFSAGPRDCLGKGQAMTVMKTTVANVIRKLKVTSSCKSVGDIILTSAVTIKPIHPIDCHFSLRLEK